VSREELKSNDWNLNIRRYADNAPPPEPHDVRAHLVGGVPKAEVEAKKDLLSAHGLKLETVFVERDADYYDFDPASGGFSDSAIGPIPKEWEVRKVESLLRDLQPSIRSGPFGSSLLKSEFKDSGIPLIGIDNVEPERFVSDFRRFVSREKFLELKRYSVRPNDVMITIMGTVGRCCVAPDDIGEALSTKHVWTLTFDEESYDPYLVCLQFNYSPWVLEHFRRDEQGGIMGAIRSETLRSTLLPRPPREEQTRIALFLRAHSARISEEEKYLHKLKLQKKGLMHDLLTGKVGVRVDRTAVNERT
jgi:type I restriction enzyme S subunit